MSIYALRDRFNRLSSIDTDRNMLISELLAQHEEHIQELAILRMDLEQEKMGRREQQNRVQRLEAAQQQHLDDKPFVMVILDGDGMLFLEDFVSNGVEGGSAAADELRLRVNEYLQSLHIGHYTIRLVMYANLFDLANTYVKKGLLSNPMDLFRFVGGFNRKFPLFQIVDAGQGKECADSKIHEVKLFINNIHCKRILFGGPHDRGYARLLDQYSGIQESRERIVLVKSVPFASEIRQLADAGWFNVVSFDTVFEQEMIVLTNGNTNGVNGHKINGSGYTNGHAKTNGNGYSPPKSAPPGLVKRSSNLSSGDLAPLFRFTGTTEVLRNQKGHRIDPPVTCSNSKLNSLRDKRYCNSYYLLGFCPYNKKKACQFEHEFKLGDDILRALVSVARLSPCASGLFCHDPECIRGHNCTAEFCVNPNTCRFPKESHGMSKKAVKLTTI